MSRNKENDLNIIKQAAKLYETNLLNKNVLFIYLKNNKVEFYEATFLLEHFKHLTGVKTQLNAHEFFYRASKNRLRLEDFDYKNNTTGLKIDNIIKLMLLNTYAKMIGEDYYRKPTYIVKNMTIDRILKNKELKDKIEKEEQDKMKELENCKICPHQCGVNRSNGNKGRCKCNDKIKIALASVHQYEEPCLSKINGSGTIFFTNCNMSCSYCQNYEISQNEKGKEVTIEELAEIMLKQQEKGVNNINLVTPTMYAYQIIEAIKIAKEKGLHIPIVYNTNGYENCKTIEDLEGYIDIYLPDLKYYSNELSKKYSKVDHYFEIATEAIKEMYKQVGKAEFDENGIMQKGMIIRHLVLPNHIQNSKHILKWIKENMPKDIYVSIMAQYFPTHKAKEDELLNRKLSKKEYKEIENYLYMLDLQNGYIQELGEHEEEYVPNFDLTF